MLDNRTHCQKRVSDEEEAMVGRFKIEPENGVRVDLAGARHSGVFAYDFPAGEQKHILVDVSHHLPPRAAAVVKDGSLPVGRFISSLRGRPTLEEVALVADFRTRRHWTLTSVASSKRLPMKRRDSVGE